MIFGLYNIHYLDPPIIYMYGSSYACQRYIKSYDEYLSNMRGTIIDNSLLFLGCNETELLKSLIFDNYDYDYDKMVII